RRLYATGRDVPLVTLTRRHDGPLADELVTAEARRLDLGLSRLADPRGPFRLARVLRDERADIVHAHGQDASILAALVRRVTRPKLLVTRHVLSEPATTWRESLRSRAALAAFRSADAPVAVSRAAA